jgi:HSP20 family protein
VRKRFQPGTLAAEPCDYRLKLRGIIDASSICWVEKAKIQNIHNIHYPKEEIMSALTRWEPLMRWSPFKELEEMEKRLSTILGRPPMGGNGEGKEAIAVSQWSPLVDITEDEKEYVVKAEIPEMKKEDIKINVHDDVLTVSGERKYEKEEKGKKYHRVERSYGSFMRSFALPEDADGSKVTAEYKDGMLKLHLPKSEQGKKKAIEVKVA